MSYNNYMMAGAPKHPPSTLQPMDKAGLNCVPPPPAYIRTTDRSTRPKHPLPSHPSRPLDTVGVYRTPLFSRHTFTPIVVRKPSPRHKHKRVLLKYTTPAMVVLGFAQQNKSGDFFVSDDILSDLAFKVRHTPATARLRALDDRRARDDIFASGLFCSPEEAPDAESEDVTTLSLLERLDELDSSDEPPRVRPLPRVVPLPPPIGDLPPFRYVHLPDKRPKAQAFGDDDDGDGASSSAGPSGVISDTEYEDLPDDSPPAPTQAVTFRSKARHMADRISESLHLWWQKLVSVWDSAVQLPKDFFITYKYGTIVRKCLDNSVPEWIVKILSFVTIVMRNTTDYVTIGAAVAGIFSREIATLALSGLTALYKIVEGIQAQAPGDDSHVIYKIYDYCASLISSVVNVDGLFDFLRFYGPLARNALSIGSFIKSTATITSSLVSALISNVELAAYYIFGYAPYLLNSRSKLALAFIDDALHQFRVHPGMASNKWGELLVKAYSSCLVLQQNSGNDGFPPATALSRKAALDTVRDTRRHTHIRATCRCRPVVIYLIGAAGVGKSTIANSTFPAMWRELYARYFPQQAAGRGTFWVRTPGTEYWDGYEHDLTVVVDDPLYIAGAKEAGQTFNEIKSMAGDVAFPLTMSAVDDKGMYYFDSPLIIVTLNQTDLKSGVAISDSSAHDRRVDFAYHVTLEGETSRFTLMECHQSVFHLAQNPSTRTVSLKDIAVAAMLKYGKHMDAFNAIADRAEVAAAAINALTPSEEKDLFTSARSRALARVDHLPKCLSERATPIAIVEPDPLFVGVINGLAALAMGYGLYAAASSLADWLNPIKSADQAAKVFIEAHSATPGTHTGKHTSRVIHTRKIQPQSGPTTDEAARAFSQRSMATLAVSFGTKGLSSRVLFIKGRYGLVPTHYWDTVLACATDDAIVCFAGTQRQLPPVLLNTVQATSLSGRDLTVLHFDNNQFPDFPDVVSHFPKADKIRSEYGSLCELIPKGDIYVSRMLTDVKACAHRLTYDYMSGVEVSLDAFILAHGESASGDCMVPMIDASNASMLKIIALHIAGAPAEQLVYGTILTQEDIATFFETIAPRPEAQGFPVNVEVIRELNPGEGVFMTSRTLHTPSLFHPFIADDLITKVPAHVGLFTNKNGDRISPLDLAITRLCSPGEFAENVDHLALRTAQVQVASLFENADVGSCTLHEALNGIEGNLYAGPIDLSTSGGWDPDHKRSGGDKHYYVSGFAPNRVLTEAGIEEYNRAVADQAKGERLTFSVHLKQELLPAEKVEVGRTRLTHCMRFGDFVLFRMKFLRLIAWSMANRHNLPFKVGINPYNAYEWTMLAKQLHLDEPESWFFLPGDFSNYDGSQCRAFIDAVLATFALFLPEDALLALERAMVERVLIVNHTMIALKFSHPTGWYLTTLWNCVATLVAIYYARNKHCALNPTDVLNLINNMAVGVYGDDNVVTVRKGSSLTWDSWRDSFTELGLKMTPAIKNRPTGICTVSEVTFLQRCFVRVGDIYSAPLTEDHVENILAWRHRDNPPLNAAVDAMKVVGLEVSLIAHAHYKSTRFFNETMEPFRSMSALIGITDPTHAYGYYRTRWIDTSLSNLAPWIAHVTPDLSVTDLMDKVSEGYVPPPPLKTPTWVIVAAEGVLPPSLKAQSDPTEAHAVISTRGAVEGNQSDAIPTTFTRKYLELPPIFKATTAFPPPFDPKILDKEYVIATGAWSGTSSTTAPILVMDPMGEILKQGFVAAMGPFIHNFRCDVEVTVRVAPSSSLSGALLVSWQSNCATTDYPMTCSAISASSLDCAVLTPITSTDLTFTIKFDAPNYWMKFHGYVPGHLGSFRFDVVLPLVSSQPDAVTSVPYTITARLIGLELDAVHSPGATIRAQSSRPTGMPEIGTIYHSNEGEDDSLRGVPNWRERHREEDAIERHANRAEDRQNRIADREEDRNLRLMDQGRVSASNASRMLPPGKEQKEESDHTGSNVVTSIAASAAALSVFPPLLPFTAPIAAIGGVVGGIMRLFGKDKPILDKPVGNVLTNPERGLNTYSGVVQAETLGASDQFRIDYAAYSRDRYDYNLAINLYNRPTLVFNSYSSASVTQTQLCGVFVQPQATTAGTSLMSVSAFAAMSQYYLYWRGSMRFRLHLVVPAFASLMVRVVWTPSLISVFPDTAAVFSHVVSCTGETIYDFTVPYRGEMFNTTNIANGYISVWAETAMNVPNTDTVPRVGVMLWMAPGPDFIYARRFNTTSVAKRASARAHAVLPMEDSLRNPSEFFIGCQLTVPTSISSDILTNFRDFCHRAVSPLTFLMAPATPKTLTLANLVGNPAWGAMNNFFRGFIGSLILNIKVIGYQTSAGAATSPSPGQFLAVDSLPSTSISSLPTAGGQRGNGTVRFELTNCGSSLTYHIPWEGRDRYVTSSLWDATDSAAVDSGDMAAIVMSTLTGTPSLHLELWVSFADDCSWIIPSAAVDVAT